MENDGDWFWGVLGDGVEDECNSKMKDRLDD